MKYLKSLSCLLRYLLCAFLLATIFVFGGVIQQQPAYAASSASLSASDCISAPLAQSGAHLETAFQNTNDNSLVDAFDFSNAVNAIFVNIYESTDGGQTWQLSDSVQSPGSYRDISFGFDANDSVVAFACNGDWNYVGAVSV